MTDKQSSDAKHDSDEILSESAHKNTPDRQQRGVLSSILLVFWYMFIAAFFIAILGLVALFVVCMV